MSFVQSILYAFLSGIASLLPISARGHQAILREIFGIQTPTPILNIIVHIGVLAAIVVSSAGYLGRLRRFLETQTGRGRQKGRQFDKHISCEYRMVRSGILPMTIVMLLFIISKNWVDQLLLTGILFALNGVAVYATEFIPHGNKDATKLSTLDGMLLGVSRGLWIFPGISGSGMALCSAVARGADMHKAYNWVLLISIPATLIAMLLELIGGFFSGVGILTFGIFAGYLVSGLFAFAGAFLAILLMRFLTARSILGGFGLYCFGAAILSLILYMMV